MMMRMERWTNGKIQITLRGNDREWLMFKSNHNLSISTSLLSVTPLLLLLLLIANRAANEGIVNIGVNVGAGVPANEAVSAIVWGSQRQRHAI